MIDSGWGASTAAAETVSEKQFFCSTGEHSHHFTLTTLPSPLHPHHFTLTTSPLCLRQFFIRSRMQTPAELAVQARLSTWKCKKNSFNVRYAHFFQRWQTKWKNASFFVEWPKCAIRDTPPKGLKTEVAWKTCFGLQIHPVLMFVERTCKTYSRPPRLIHVSNRTRTGFSKQLCFCTIQTASVRSEPNWPQTCFARRLIPMQRLPT